MFTHRTSSEGTGTGSTFCPARASSVSRVAPCRQNKAQELAAAEAALTAEAGRAEQHHGDSPNPALVEKDARPLGRGMEFWAEQWWRCIYSIPADRNLLLDPTLDSNQDQSGPVYFLADGDRTSTVPRGRVIAATVSTAADDYPCPDRRSSRPRVSRSSTS